MNDLTIEALIDNGTSHNFILKSLVQHMQWQTSTMDQLVVQIAARSKDFTAVTCLVYLQISVLTSIKAFYVLDSSLDIVVVIPWLHKVNPRIDWDEQTVCMYHNCWWVSLPVCSIEKVVQPSVNAANDVETDQDPVGPHKLHLESANQFSKRLKKADQVFVGFVSAIGECNFAHHITHGGVIDNQLDPKSQALLDDMQSCYPKVFKDSQYPITENRILFRIQLVDDKIPPPKRKLYSLSEPKLQELRKQLKVLLYSSRIVPSASLYGAPILLVAKKDGAGLRMYTDYHSLNSNIITNSFSLPRINELLVRLHGSKVFSKFYVHDEYHQIPAALDDCHKAAFNC